MGNSNSQFKRSRSQYGSTRSVAFSLPSKWDRRSYAYGEPLNQTLTSSSSMRAPPKPILRNNSGSSKVFTYRNGLSSNNDLSRSLHSLQETSHYDQQRRFSLPQKPVTNGRSDNQLTQRQYSDIYLKNDLRRVFRSQDRANSVAQLSENDQSGFYDSTVSLDRKLSTLKAQRDYASQNFHSPQLPEEPRREGAIERRIKSRKSKKAPLPNGNAQRYSGSHIASKPEGMYRKKSNAPQPPVRERARSLSSLNVRSDSEIYNLQSANSSSQHSLFHEIEAELAKQNIPISPTHEEKIEIPRPDYDNQQITPLGIPIMPSQSQLTKAVGKLKKVKPKAPPTPVKIGTASQVSTQSPNAQLSPIHSSGQVSTNANISKLTSGSTITADVEIHNKPSFLTETPKLQTRAPTLKKEVREIAIQYDAPVEIAIQCSGNTLKSRVRRSSSNSSLTELLQLFNDVIQSGKVEVDQKAESKANDVTDSRSSCSDASSSRSRNSAQQKIVPMHEVLAGVPEPPPLPDFNNIKLLQTRTIKENAPISMAPVEPAPVTRNSQDDTESLDAQPTFSSFQQQLLEAYEKIGEKRRNNPTVTNSGHTRRQEASTSEGGPLKVFRHASTIMGIQTPHETESDSGHDEPSDCSNSQGGQTPSIPDFVLDGIAKSLHTESEFSFDGPSKSVKKNDKSKFNSIRRLKKSVRQLLSKSKSSDDQDIPYSDIDHLPPLHSDENWTLSGRDQPSRASITTPDTFSATITPEIHQFDKERTRKISTSKTDLSKDSPHFKQTNMKSFALLTPIGYMGASKKHQHVTSSSTSTPAKRNQLQRQDSMADVPL